MESYFAPWEFALLLTDVRVQKKFGTACRPVDGLPLIPHYLTVVRLLAKPEKLLHLVVTLELF